MSRFAVFSPILSVGLLAGCRGGPAAEHRVDYGTQPVAVEALADAHLDPMGQLERDGALEVYQASHFSEPESPSQSARFDGPVELADLVRYALACNPRIQAARYHARALGARVPQARSLPDPQLMTTIFLEEIQTAAGPQELALALSQKIPWFGKRAFRSQVAYYDAMAAYARVTATELEVVEQVKRAYFDLYFFQNAITETRRLEPRLQQVIDVVRTQYETSTPGVGLERVRQAQVELAKLKIQLVELEEAKVRAQARLAEVLHLPPNAKIEPAAEVPRSRLAQQVDSLVGLAAAWEPELEARRREVRRDQASVSLAERDYWPDVNLGVNWYEMGSSGLSPVANGRDAVSLGLGVNLPVYRARLDAAVREAQHKTSASARRYAAERDRVQAEVGTLYARFREHDRMLNIVGSEILPMTEEMLALAPEAYSTGRMTFQQWIDAYRTLLAQKVDLHRHFAAREQAVASLERAVGSAIADAEGGAPPSWLDQPAPLPRQ